MTVCIKTIQTQTHNSTCPQKFSNVDFSPTDFIVSFWLAAKLQKFERQRVYLQHITNGQSNGNGASGAATGLVDLDTVLDHRALTVFCCHTPLLHCTLMRLFLLIVAHVLCMGCCVIRPPLTTAVARCVDRCLLVHPVL